MPGIFTNLYNKAEELNGPRLFRTLAIVFIVFILIGVVIGYFIPGKLNNSEEAMANSANNNTQSDASNRLFVSLEGTVTFIGEAQYAEDEVKYALLDKSGNRIILLKSEDAKLSIAENLFVKVSGRRQLSVNNKDFILRVNSLTINNVSN